MKKFICLISIIFLLCASVILPASAELAVIIEPDEEGNIILSGEGTYTICNNCTLNRLEINSGAINVRTDVEVTVNESIIIAENSSLIVTGTLTASENCSFENSGTLKIMCCGKVFGIDESADGIVSNVHKFVGSDKCSYCSELCPHNNTLTFCTDCGTVLQSDVDASNFAFTLNAKEPTELPIIQSQPAVSTVVGSTGDDAILISGSPEFQSLPITASAFSEGNLTIIVGISCLAVGFLIATLIFKNRKAK